MKDINIFIQVTWDSTVVSKGRLAFPNPLCLAYTITNHSCSCNKAVTTILDHFKMIQLEWLSSRKKQQILARMQRNRIPYTLLVAMEITITMKGVGE
jgi:hypothetical protein